jgi:hypothetical protein
MFMSMRVRDRSLAQGEQFISYIMILTPNQYAYVFTP